MDLLFIIPQNTYYFPVPLHLFIGMGRRGHKKMAAEMLLKPSGFEQKVT